jgi:hypothetical protein
MNNALTLHRMLLEKDIPHEIVRLPRRISSADQLPAALGLPAKRCLDNADDATIVYTVTGESGAALGLGLAGLLATCAAKPAALTGRQ